MENLSVFLQKYKRGYFLEHEIGEEIKKFLQKKGIGKELSGIKMKVSFKKETLFIQTNPICKQYLLLHQKQTFLIANTLTKRIFTKIL